MAWPSAIQHSKSAQRHSSNAKWHSALPSLIRTISCNFAFSSIFLKNVKHSKKKKKFWLNWGIQTCLTHLFSKIITCIIIFKNWSNQDFFQAPKYISQTRGIRPWLIHFQKEKRETTIIIFSKKKSNHQDFQKSCIHLKLGAFGFASSK